MPINQDADTGKWKIGAAGQPRYTTQEKAQNAYNNYLKRGGDPVPPVDKPEGETLG